MAALVEPRLHPATYKGWDGCRLERGPLALVLVPQIGGRVMGVQWRGQELSFVNPDYEGRVEDVAAIADVHARKRQLGFLLWGGEKTWLAPQSRWTGDVPFGSRTLTVMTYVPGPTGVPAGGNWLHVSGMGGTIVLP